MNVICVKWGTKYGPEYVNRLYRMVKKHFTVPFTFYCYTEDPTGLESFVNVVDIHTDLEIYWNKLGIFKKGLFSGECLFFDLDLVIQQNIDFLADYTDALYGIHTQWDPVITDGSFSDPRKRWRYPFNSSVMRWNAEKWTHVWDVFEADMDYYLVEFHCASDDKFMIHTIPGIKTFDKLKVYSRLYGSEPEHEDLRLHYWRTHLKPLTFYYPDYHICLFNGDTKEEHYVGFEKYMG